jgi:hypothetical protein
VSASEFGDIRRVARQTFVTSTCGLGLPGETAVAPSFSLVRQLATLLERLAREGDDASEGTCMD